MTVSQVVILYCGDSRPTSTLQTEQEIWANGHDTRESL